jgi:hypothetical protein
VVAVVDAMTDRDAEAHHYNVEKIFPKLAETATTDGALRLLEQAGRGVVKDLIE